MARKRHTAEEIVAKLRQVDVLMAQGKPVADSVRAIGVTKVTYYRWRNELSKITAEQSKTEHPSENTLYLAELLNWRVQKLLLHL